jgi:hypothetical protein
VPLEQREADDQLLKQITAGLFDDEDATTGDEDSVAGLPALKGRQFLRVRRSVDESVSRIAAERCRGGW